MAWHDEVDKGGPVYAIATDSKKRVRVLAGPGTGKSFAMNRRVARLLEEGSAPGRVLAVTFTRMAADDLVREIRGLKIDGSEKVHARTLHSLCFSILAQNHVIGITGRHPRTLAKFEIRPLVADLQRFGLGKARQINKNIRAYEAAWARLQHETPGVPDDVGDLKFENLLIQWLTFHRAMLIGEIVPFAYHYLRNSPGAPERREFDEVLVDEFQDLNKAEQEVVVLLASAGRLFVVGDDDQSIYSFKFAHPQGIQEFGEGESDFSQHALVDCFRSPEQVVTMANHLIAHNVARVDPDRFLSPLPAKGHGIVDVYQFPTLGQEADWLATQISSEIASGVPLGSIIVLCPDRHLARPLHGRLKDADIPVRFCFEESQLDSPKSRNRLAILGWAARPDDRVLLRYLLGEGSASWRANQWFRVVQICRNEGKPPVAVLDEIVAGRKIPYTRQIKDRYTEISVEAATLTKLQGIELVASWLLAQDPTDDDDRLAELRCLALEFVEAEPELPVQSLYDALIDEITQPEVPDQVTEVRIMSLHKSKGLSANLVIITGIVEGGIPRHAPSDITEAEADVFVEEQRRLFYVGITRVKAEPKANRPGRLILSHVMTAPTEIVKRSGLQITADHGGYSSLLASRFLAELGAPEGKNP